MLDGWYCRTLAEQAAASQTADDDDNEQNGADSGSEDSQDGNNMDYNPKENYKAAFMHLAEKLRALIHENEFFQEALRSSQRKFLKISRDRSFLLDRLLQYEKPEESISESDDTESSDESSRIENKKRKLDNNSNSNAAGGTNAKKRRTTSKPKVQEANLPSDLQTEHMGQDGHMTAEEVERHLQSRQSITELVPERAPPTVPTEMFSNEPSLDSESNDQMIETSPSNIGEEVLSVDLNIVKNEFNTV